MHKMETTFWRAWVRSNGSLDSSISSTLVTPCRVSSLCLTSPEIQISISKQKRPIWYCAYYVFESNDYDSMSYNMLWHELSIGHRHEWIDMTRDRREGHPCLCVQVTHSQERVDHLQVAKSCWSNGSWRTTCWQRHAHRHATHCNDS